MNFLIQLNESDKRILIALCLVLILVFILIGYIGKFIRYLIRITGDYVEKSMYDILDADLIQEKKHFFNKDFQHWSSTYIKNMSE